MVTIVFSMLKITRGLKNFWEKLGLDRVAEVLFMCELFCLLSDVTTHGTTKLVMYFHVMSYCLISRTEKLMVSEFEILF